MAIKFINLVTNNDYASSGDVQSLESDLDNLNNSLDAEQTARILGDSKNWVKLADNSVNNSDPITSYPIDVVSVVAVSFSQTTGFPNGDAGTIITDRRGSATFGYAYQKYYPYASNRVYFRKWTQTNGNPPAWSEIITGDINGDLTINNITVDEHLKVKQVDLNDSDSVLNLGQTRDNFTERGSHYLALPRLFSRSKQGTSFTVNHITTANGNSWNPIRIYANNTMVAGDWAKLKYPQSYIGVVAPNYVTSGRRSFVIDMKFSMHTGVGQGERSIAIGTLNGNDPMDNATLFGDDGANNRYGYALVLSHSGHATQSRYNAKLVASQSGDVVEDTSTTEYYSSNNVHVFRVILTETLISVNTVRVDCAVYTITENDTTSNTANLQFTRSVTVNTSNVAPSTSRHCILARTESVSGTVGFNILPLTAYKEVTGITHNI